jgi:serine/threonine protein kinase/CRP-like cAMP-binding protein
MDESGGFALEPATVAVEKPASPSSSEEKKGNGGGGSWESVVNIEPVKEKKLLVDILKDLSLFCELSEEQALLIYKNLSKVSTGAGEVIYSKGDDANRIYIIYSGKFVARKDGGDAVELPKKYFGESALMFQGRRAETIVSTTEGMLWTIDRLTYQRQCVKGQQNAATKKDDFLSSVPVLAPLPHNTRVRIASALVRVVYSPGEFIIRQGEIGDAFYIIENGEVVVKEHAGRYRIGEMNDDAVEVVRRYTGDYFGEVALMKDEPRNADIIAVNEVTCLKLSREDFVELMTHPLNELLEYNNAHRVLRSMDLLKPLSDDKLTELAECLQEHIYHDGDHICRQGEPGRHFYIIKSGQVKCTRLEEGQAEEQEIGDLFAGDYFGEGALLTDNPRRANVIAVGDVKVLALGRDQFNAVLGSLRAVMDKTFSTREKAGQSKDVPFNELEKIRTIGSGSYGTVDLVRHSVTGATYALKRIRKALVVKANHQQFVQNEKDILRMCSHPFLVNLVCTYSDKTCVYMLTEVCLGGELYTLMKDTVESAPYDENAEVPGCFPMEVCQFYLANVVCALGYLHGLGICHRDVKPENLLIAGNGCLKLADFGFAKDLKGNRSYSLCGTPQYTAPEVYKRAGHGCAVDWWALGVLLYEMASGFSPFHVESENSWDCYLEISRYSKSYPNLQFPQIFPKDLCYLLVKLLHPNPFHRLGSGRNGLQEIKTHAFFDGLDWEALESMKIKAPYLPPITNIMDTSHFERYEFDPHGEDAALEVEDPTGGAWVEGF